MAYRRSVQLLLLRCRLTKLFEPDYYLLLVCTSFRFFSIFCFGVGEARIIVQQINIVFKKQKTRPWAFSFVRFAVVYFRASSSNLLGKISLLPSSKAREVERSIVHLSPPRRKNRHLTSLPPTQNKHRHLLLPIFILADIRAANKRATNT